MDTFLSAVNYFADMLMKLSDGMVVSVLIFVLTLIFSLPLGLLVSFGRMSKNKIVRTIVTFYISVMRGTPLMLQLFVVYYGPYYLFGMSTAGWRFPATIIGFVLNYAAYFAEIYRSGIESIPVGQYEAANVLGLSKPATFMRIILPQVIKRILPPITNETITLVKDTSLAYAISTLEMFTLAKQHAAADASIMPLMVAGVFYYIFNLIVAFVMGRIEKKLSYYR